MNAPIYFQNRWAVITLTMGLLLVGSFLVGGRGARLGLSTVDLPNQAPLLDSFATPAIALAVLDQELQRLLMNYGQTTRDSTPAAVNSGADARQQLPQRAGEAAFDKPRASELDELYRQIQELKAQLDCRLMWVYGEQNRDREFVDCYLHLIEVKPAMGDVSLWLTKALKSAQRCGRTDELLDELRHFMQFRSTPQRLSTVNQQLEKNGFKPLIVNSWAAK